MGGNQEEMRYLWSLSNSDRLHRRNTPHSGDLIEGRAGDRAILALHRGADPDDGWLMDRYGACLAGRPLD